MSAIRIDLQADLEAALCKLREANDRPRLQRQIERLIKAWDEWEEHQSDPPGEWFYVVMAEGLIRQAEAIRAG